MEKELAPLEGDAAPILRPLRRQADPIAVPMVEERMSNAREKVSSATPKTLKAKKPLLASLKNLLNAL